MWVGIACGSCVSLDCQWPWQSAIAVPEPVPASFGTHSRLPSVLPPTYIHAHTHTRTGNTHVLLLTHLTETHHKILLTAGMLEQRLLLEGMHSDLPTRPLGTKKSSSMVRNHHLQDQSVIKVLHMPAYATYLQSTRDDADVKILS